MPLRQIFAFITIVVALGVSAASAQETRLSDSRLYGYQLSRNAAVVVETNVGETRVWLMDARISAWPLLIGQVETGFGIESLELPVADFQSIGREMSDAVRFSDHANQVRNLMHEGLFVIPMRRTPPRGSISFNAHLIIDLAQVYKRQWHSHVDFFVVPARSSEFPERQFQMRATKENFHIVRVVDSNARGQARHLNFLLKGGDAFQILRSDIDLNRLVGTPRVSANGKTITDEDGSPFARLESAKLRVDELQFGAVVASTDRTTELRTHTNFPRSIERYQATLSAEDFDYKTDINYRSRPFSYDVYDFLASHGKLRRTLTKEAFYHLFRNLPAATNDQHLKLKISPLGLMTYQKASDAPPVFLGMVGKNQPVAIVESKDVLKLTLENGEVAEFDINTGLKRSSQRAPVNIRSCRDLFTTL